MKEEIRKMFHDEDSVKLAIELVSKTDLNNVEVSHLYALLNGVPASKIDKTRGAGGKVYYGLVYRDFNAANKKGPARPFLLWVNRMENRQIPLPSYPTSSPPLSA